MRFCIARLEMTICAVTLKNDNLSFIKTIFVFYLEITYKKRSFNGLFFFFLLIFVFFGFALGNGNNERVREHQAKVNEYVSVAKTLIEAARFSGKTITIEDIAEALELSVSGVSRYPQISTLLGDIR